MTSYQPVAWMVYALDGQSCYVTDNPADISPDQRALPLFTEPVPTDEALLRQALEALEGVAQWVEKRPDTHPWDAWQRVEPAITALRERLGAKA